MPFPSESAQLLPLYAKLVRQVPVRGLGVPNGLTIRTRSAMGSWRVPRRAVFSGIAALLARDGQPAPSEDVLAMLDAIPYRGPDGSFARDFGRAVSATRAWR